jgi:trans-aconitate methyltransferase
MFAAKEGPKNLIRRVRPGDAQWPNQQAWHDLARRVDGRLVPAELPYQICIDQSQSSACEDRLEQLKNPFFIQEQPAGTQSTGWLNGWEARPSGPCRCRRNSSGHCPGTLGFSMSSSNTQHWNPAQYGKNGRFVSDLGMPVVELLSPQSGERILDLGCGDGALTIKLVELGCTLVGVDSSAEMVRTAKSLGLDARIMDGQSLRFANEFDAVFSNAALHWMKNPECVIAGVWRALKPGGRFVGEFGGYGNVATIVTALESALSSRGLAVASPWFFPRPEEYRVLLEASGFQVKTIDLIPRPTLLPGDVGGWLETFAQPYTSAVPAVDRQSFISEVVEALCNVLCDTNGNWYADYVRLRFFATKPNTAI